MSTTLASKTGKIICSLLEFLLQAFRKLPPWLMLQAFYIFLETQILLIQSWVSCFHGAAVQILCLGSQVAEVTPCHPTVRPFNLKQASHLCIKGKVSKSLRFLICSAPKFHSGFLFWFYRSLISGLQAENRMLDPLLEVLCSLYSSGIQRWLEYCHESALLTAYIHLLPRFIFLVPSLSL